MHNAASKICSKKISMNMPKDLALTLPIEEIMF